MEDGPLRALDMSFNQTNPPTGPGGSATEVIFDPASTSLWVVIKGDPVSRHLSKQVLWQRQPFKMVAEERGLRN